MTNKELLEKIAEAINDSTESIEVITPSTWFGEDYRESSIQVINPELLMISLRKLSDSL